MLSPSNQIWPEVGARKEAISLKQVLLPAPFGPISERISPCSTEKETSLTAVRPPKRQVQRPNLEHGHCAQPLPDGRRKNTLKTPFGMYKMQRIMRPEKATV